MNTLKDILVYFAKFPAKNGVLDLFNKEVSDQFSNYSNLLTEISTLSTHSLVPGIGKFVIGLDEKTISARIQEIGGTYLFIDYGHITSDRDGYDRQNDRLMIALTVATPLAKESLDLVEQVLLSDLNLNYLLQIRDIMKEDSRCNPFVQQLSFPNEITPFYARELSDSVGWTMVFEKTGIGMV